MDMHAWIGKFCIAGLFDAYACLDRQGVLSIGAFGFVHP